jgi:hypothetical protein
MTELLKLSELVDLLFRFPHCDRHRQGFTDRLALNLIGQTQIGAMAGILRLGTVAGRFSAASDDAGDGTRTQVAQLRERAQQIALLLLQLNQGRRQGCTSITERRIYVQNRATKKNHYRFAISMSCARCGGAG